MRIMPNCRLRQTRIWGVHPIAKLYTRQYYYGVYVDGNISIHQDVRLMKRKFSPQPVAPPETREPNRPVEPVALAPETIPELTPRTTQVPDESFEERGDSYYSQHWGINE